MVPWVVSEQLAAVSADGAESQAGWMLRVAQPQLSGGVPSPHWAAWSCSQTMLLLPCVSKTDCSFLMCSEQMLVVGLRGLLLCCCPALPPAVPLFSWQSYEHGPVNDCQLLRT
jgi:hypothetical protein